MVLIDTSSAYEATGEIDHQYRRKMNSQDITQICILAPTGAKITQMRIVAPSSPMKYEKNQYRGSPMDFANFDECRPASPGATLQHKDPEAPSKGQLGSPKSPKGTPKGGQGHPWRLVHPSW